VAQDVRFCRTDDGVRLAWARHGSGPPLLIVSCWLSHLQHDWQSPVWRHFLDDLGEMATVIRYDERGFGLSEWDVADFSLARRLADLEALVEATGLDRFAVLGMSGGAPVALAYAHAHPERVTRMVLYGGMARGGLQQQDDAAEEAFLAMIRAGWARPDPLFRRVFTNAFIPDATEEQMLWMDELQRTSTNTENAVCSRIARHQVDITGLLPGIATPTLVLHAGGDRVAPDWGPKLAAEIPDARLVMLDSRNHVLLADEPAWGVFRREVADFLAADRVSPPTTHLSEREREILLLAAEGLDNAEIAERLTLSVRTVERHFQNVYLKLGLSGRTARAAAVARVLA
jgi:pimeloyl-ACP methyl ester carboxylesterase/DNA-binding CsgD family transcriptional regulator